jgi:hypothetical protein
MKIFEDYFETGEVRNFHSPYVVKMQLEWQDAAQAIWLRLSKDDLPSNRLNF